MEQKIIQILGKPIRELLERESMNFEQLQEIRLRVGQPVIVLYRGQEYILPTDSKVKKKVKKEEIRETIEYISDYSLYAYENEMKQGFLTIEGGHRVGMAGQVVVEEGKVKNLKYISSVNIRISHEIPGCASRIFPYITADKEVCHTLIISPPRCGKTTILRDLIRQVSDGNEWVKGCTVGVVDERSELGACYLGVAQNHLGMRTDILDCCPKAEGMLMLIRSMAPQVIAVDEIGICEDVHAIEYAMHCGCRMIATVHGNSMEEIRRKPLFEQMIKNKRFERYVVLGNQNHIGEIEGIFDERGTFLYGDGKAEDRCRKLSGVY